MDRVMYKELRRTAGIERELASREKQRGLRMEIHFHLQRRDEYRIQVEGG